MGNDIASQSAVPRRLYLLRHGEPDAPAHTCLGARDVPLSRLGRMRAALAAAELPRVTQVFCSPLLRARETAAALPGAAETADGLRELGMGSWESLPFDVIRARWSALYEKRGETPFDCVPEGGEAPADCLARAREALADCLARSRGDIAVVAHAGVNRLLLCALAGRPMNEFLRIPQPCGCVNTLLWDGERLTAERIAAQPRPAPTEALCERLLAAAGTPEAVRAHARAVAARAQELAEALAAHGYALDGAALYAAALLHDLARPEEDHARLGAAWLRALGYPELGALVAEHHDLPAECERVPGESAVLYLADKQVCGTERVNCAQRFAASRAKCETAEARESHERRFRQTEHVERMIYAAAGGPI